jgi:hypothetical protein
MAPPATYTPHQLRCLAAWLPVLGADLARLVTAIVRGDRFTEGNLAGAMQRGFVTAICRRAAVLLGEPG